jgi:hypothetical protein
MFSRVAKRLNQCASACILDPMNSTNTHELAPSDRLAFALAGNARFTLRNTATGNRFTYRVRVSDDGRLHFVSLLTGPDNESAFQYLGTIRNGEYRHGTRSRIGADAQSARAFTWAWPRLDRLPACIEVWHEGRCGRCGRALTVPESIAQGLGPECARQSQAA